MPPQTKGPNNGTPRDQRTIDFQNSDGFKSPTNCYRPQHLSLLYSPRLMSYICLLYHLCTPSIMHHQRSILMEPRPWPMNPNTSPQVSSPKSCQAPLTPGLTHASLSLHPSEAGQGLSPWQVYSKLRVIHLPSSTSMDLGPSPKHSSANRIS